MNGNLNLKIYGITKVWPKWQVIIPKDCREGFDVKSGDNFSIVMIDKKAFGVLKLWLMNDKENCSKEKSDFEDFWRFQIWTKYQFVIPSGIRKELWINTKDNLLVIWKQKNKGKKWLWFIKTDNIEYLLDFIKDYAKT